MNVLKEKQGGASGKGKNPSSETSTPPVACGSSSNSGVGLNRDKNECDILSSIPIGHVHEPQGNSHNRTLKLDFPKFNGENPRLWLRKCVRYFPTIK